MFRKMQNIESAFRYVRGFTLLVILACVMITCFVLHKSYNMVSRLQDKVYILTNGKVLEAFASNRKDNIPVEARDHVKTFHHLFFTLDPDDKVIRADISRALYLAYQSAEQEYENLKEKGYYAGIISGNISQTIHVDSVNVDVNDYPYYFHCYATQQIIRTTTVVYRSLVTEGYLRNVSRSDNNPHGFLIEHWRILENKDLKTVDRRFGNSISRILSDQR